MSIAHKTQPERIEFRCTCGARFRVDARLAGRRATCKTCNASMTIPHASTAEPVAAEQESAKEHERLGQATERQEVALQALCSICQSPIDDGEDILACPECHLPFHAECWQENMGCAAYGCPQVNALKKGPDLTIGGLPAGGQDGEYSRPVWHCAVGSQFYGPASALELSAWVRDKRITRATMVWKAGMANWVPISSLPELLSFVDPGHAAQSSDAGFPWELVLLAASAIGFLLSLVACGIPSLLVMIGTGVFGTKRFRDAGGLPAEWKGIAVLILAFVVSLAGFLAGVIVSM